jgi:Mce-associated membrane protein
VPASTPKPGPRPWIAAIAAFVLVAGLAVADLALFQDRHKRPGTAEQRQRVVAEVNQAMATILSYDYRHLDADEGAAASHLTGTFKDQYLASMNTTIKKNAPPAKAVVVGEVGTSAITSVSGDGTQAVLLVLGQQTVTNASQKTPRYDMVNLRVTAQLVHGTWLVADLATL